MAELEDNGLALPEMARVLNELSTFHVGFPVGSNPVVWQALVSSFTFESGVDDIDMLHLLLSFELRVALMVIVATENVSALMLGWSIFLGVIHQTLQQFSF